MAAGSGGTQTGVKSGTESNHGGWRCQPWWSQQARWHQLLLDTRQYKRLLASAMEAMATTQMLKTLQAELMGHCGGWQLLRWL